MNIIIDGLNTNYIDEGIGTEVLLLHGWGANINTMLPIVNMLKNNCRVIALDMPGFGYTDIPPKPWNSYDYARFVEKFIEKLSLKNIILFGHSHGGRVSIILSSQNPNLIKKLILIDSAGIKPRRTPKYYIKLYKFKLLKKIYSVVYKKNKNEKIEQLYKKHGSSDYKNTNGVMRQTIVKVLHDYVKPLLSKINCPTLLVWGENDKDTPLYMAKTMHKYIKDSGIIVLNNAGHFSYIDDYKTFRAVIESFLKEDID